jgi:DNA-binding IclR family transcriptional regulator
MRLIEFMAAENKASYGVRELAQEMGIAPSSIHRLLNMLQQAGVVVVEDSGRYGFSLRFFALASQVSHLRYPLFQVALRHCQELATSTGESIYIGMYDRESRQFMYTESVRSRNPINYTMPKFHLMPLYPGAGGVSILAFLPRAEQDLALAEMQVYKVTDRTVTDRDEIDRLLAEVRAKGYAISVGRRIVGGAGVGAPLIGPDGRVQGNIVIAMPEARFRDYDPDELGRQVMATAEAAGAAGLIKEEDTS